MNSGMAFRQKEYGERALETRPRGQDVGAGDEEGVLAEARREEVPRGPNSADRERREDSDEEAGTADRIAADASRRTAVKQTPKERAEESLRNGNVVIYKGCGGESDAV